MRDYSGTSTAQTAEDLASEIVSAVTIRMNAGKGKYATIATDHHWWADSFCLPWRGYIQEGSICYSPDISSEELGRALRTLGFKFIMASDQSSFGYACPLNAEPFNYYPWTYEVREIG